jgi:hypothetical protein
MGKMIPMRSPLIAAKSAGMPMEVPTPRRYRNLGFPSGCLPVEVFWKHVTGNE